MDIKRNERFRSIIITVYSLNVYYRSRDVYYMYIVMLRVAVGGIG